MKTIFVQTSGMIGKKMAGPAIRSWEFAKALSKDYKVVLVHPGLSEIMGEGFELLSRNSQDYWKCLSKADCVITQNLTFKEAYFAKKQGSQIIIDAYDPLPLEMLELFKYAPKKTREDWTSYSTAQLVFNFNFASEIICASEKQRDLWIGFLLSQGLIETDLYDKDPSLRNLIDVVPFGLSSTAPKKNGPGAKEHFGLKESDKILIWGGGIWNWFDPLTLIKGMDLLKNERSDIKLVFLGIKTPDPNIPEMKMALEAVELASSLGLKDKTVFFNHDWVPYDQRQNYLLDASIGVSTHFDHLETRFSFRTRILDYLWADLPILTTEGDSFADLVESKSIGKSVPYENPEALAKAILELLEEKEEQSIRNKIEQEKKSFEWEKVVQPICKMIDSFERKTDKSSLKAHHIRTLAQFLPKAIKHKGIWKCLTLLKRRIKG